MEIRRPREDRLPFLCHLNFTAAGSDLGDLVQVGHRNDVVVENNADWCPAGVGVCHGTDSGPTRRAGARIIIYIPAFTILIAFIGEIKSAPALSKHRVHHRGIRLLYRSLILEL